MKTLMAALLFVATPAFAYIDAFPSSVRFSDTQVNNRSFPQSITISNRGPSAVRNISVSNACGINFDVQGWGCSGPLNQYQSCRIQVTFTPHYEGSQSCTIFVNSDGGSTTLFLSGRATKRP